MSNSDSDDEVIDPYDDCAYDEPADFFYGKNDNFSPQSQTSCSYSKSNDAEFLQIVCLNPIDVERIINEAIDSVTKAIPVTPGLAKILLFSYKWDIVAIADNYRKDHASFLIKTRIKPLKPPAPLSHETDNSNLAKKPHLASTSSAFVVNNVCLHFCNICLANVDCRNFTSLACGHYFCKFCWRIHFRLQILAGFSTGSMECMNCSCHLLAPEDFVNEALQNSPEIRARYSQQIFQELVKSNPQLRFCPGPDCSKIIQAKQPKAKKVTCNECHMTYCFVCGLDYHAPCTCDDIKLWLLKCADDSETANYLTANTKDCPQCGVCIEKNGGCNHICCSKCKQHFCWVCSGDWKTHMNQYYQCSKYKETQNLESAPTAARRALEKYLFYFERWDNHQRSLKLEEQMVEKIKTKIDEKVNNHQGTWIDWQYLYDAAALLTKCRYTLQHTYPCAYYLPNNAKKRLFEYQQAQLESEIENLAWKVEHAEATDRGDMERQMHVAELKRKTLLNDFSN